MDSNEYFSTFMARTKGQTTRRVTKLNLTMPKTPTKALSNRRVCWGAELFKKIILCVQPSVRGRREASRGREVPGGWLVVVCHRTGNVDTATPTRVRGTSGQFEEEGDAERAGECVAQV